jgi:hypothetical protein
LHESVAQYAHLLWNIPAHAPSQKAMVIDIIIAQIECVHIVRNEKDGVFYARNGSIACFVHRSSSFCRSENARKNI